MRVTEEEFNAFCDRRLVFDAKEWKKEKAKFEAVDDHVSIAHVDVLYQRKNSQNRPMFYIHEHHLWGDERGQPFTYTLDGHDPVEISLTDRREQMTVADFYKTDMTDVERSHWDKYYERQFQGHKHIGFIFKELDRRPNFLPD